MVSHSRLFTFDVLNEEEEKIMVTPQQIRLVKSSWRRLQGIQPETIAGLFYARLFASHPGLRRMFPEDMELQYKKLMDMLHTIVMRLDNLEKLGVELAAMASRHEGYGVKPVHYKYVGESLLWTLEKGLGNEWTEEVANAWKESYAQLTASMLQEI